MRWLIRAVPDAPIGKRETTMTTRTICDATHDRTARFASQRMHACTRVSRSYKEGFVCDVCGARPGNNVNRWWCDLCTYDVCQACAKESRSFSDLFDEVRCSVGLCEIFVEQRWFVSVRRFHARTPRTHTHPLLTGRVSCESRRGVVDRAQNSRHDQDDFARRRRTSQGRPSRLLSPPRVVC